MLNSRVTRRSFMKGTAIAAGAAGLGPHAVFAQDPKAPVTITFWTILDPKSPAPRSVAQSKIIESFTEVNPDVKVEVVAMNFSRIGPMLIQAGAAGTGPDVVKVFQPWLTQPVKAGALLSLNDLLSAWPKEKQSDFIFPLSTTTYDNVVYSLLHELRTDLFWYRKDVLEKAGLAVPKTWDQVGQVAGDLSSDRLIGYGVGASSQQGAAAVAEWFHPMIWGAGGELFDPNGNALINSDAGVRALQWVRDLVHKYKGAPAAIANLTTDGQLDGVKSGSIAMTIDQSTRLGSARTGQGIGMNLVTAPVPSFGSDRPGPTGSSGQTLAIGKNSKHREAAWRFIDHYLSPASQVIDATVSGGLPSRKSSYQNQFFSSPEGMEMKGWADYMSSSGKMPLMPESYPQLIEFEALAIQSVVLNNADPKRALDQAVQSYNAVKNG